MYNIDYWDGDGATKTFTHPIEPDWLQHIDKSASVLDFGCGYGRLLTDLSQLGFHNITGYDPSQSMIDRAQIENPGADYTTDLKTASKNPYDLILCFALFTSCPTDEDQTNLTRAIDQVSAKNTLLYISDYETTDNPQYDHRYRENALGFYGSFKTSEATFRHHQPDHFGSLFTKWEMTQERTSESKTLNGHPITIHQYLYRKTG